jgi:hypothetical protein
MIQNTDNANQAEAVEGAAAFAAKAVQMTGGAVKDLRLFSEALDGRLWGSSDLADALRAFLLRSDFARLRILVNEAQSAVRNSPRLIELGRRLSSRVELRQPPYERRQNYRGEYLVADRSVLLERREPGALTAKFWVQAPAVIQLQITSFDELWDQSEPPMETRSLGI